MSYFRVFLLLTLVASCASKPTPYQKEKKKEGYRDEVYEDLKVTTFKANEHTKKEMTQTYAEFRAIENCRESENTHANIIDISDKTVEKNVVRTTGSGWGPTYGFGMYPYYSRYSSFGFGAGFNTISSNSWNETLVYPVIQVFYTCSDKVWRPQLILKEISVEQMKLLVKDLRGALQIEKVLEDSPNQKVLEVGDIIIKANGKRVEKVYEFIRLFHSADAVILVELLREGERKTAKLSARDITEDVVKAEGDIIARVCREKEKKEQKSLKKSKLCL